MSKLDLNQYSDREIITAFFNLSAMKFIAVMNAMSVITDRMTTRGKLIAQDNSDEIVDNMIRNLFEGEE